MRVAVLGGGLQGACVAMELAARGVAVELYEECERCVTRTSAQNEGKVHLGYVYANDPTLSTARTMVRGGLSFAPLLRRWLGDALDSVPVTPAFNYIVHRESLLSPDAVEAHLLACRELALEQLDGATPDYFGADPRVASARLDPSEWRDLYDPDAARAAFSTPEVGIDPNVLAQVVRDRVDGEPAIRCRLGTHVKGVQRNGAGLDVEFENGAGPGSVRYDQVVNALWEGRLVVDRTIGLEPARRWLWRMRHLVRLRAPGAHVPCTTMVLGPFGDVVAYGDGSVHLSWYPAGLKGVSTDLEPPSWPDAAAAGFSDELVTEVLAEVGAIVPAVARLPRDSHISVQGGVVFAWGETDIDDPDSKLHERYQIGPHSVDGYHSIDTGKLTTAPLFARMTADRVLAAA